MQHLKSFRGLAKLLVAAGILALAPVATEAVECRAGADAPPAVISACSAALAEAGAAGDKAKLLTELARVQRKAGDTDAAAIAINEAIALAPGDADAWIEKGFLAYDLGDLEGVLAANTRARDAQPDYWRAVLERLDALANLGRYEECLDDSAKALELAPERAHTYAYRGRCLAELRRTAEAIDDYQRAATIGLEQAFLHSNMALAYIDAGDYEPALAAARHAISLDAEYETAHWSVVEALMGLGRHQEAIDAYRATQAAGLPDTQGRANQLAWLLYLAGDHEAAHAIMAAYFAAEPELGAEQAFEADTYGHILAALGETDAAVGMFQLAVQLGGAGKAASYEGALQQLGIEADAAALEPALRACVERRAGCRISE